MSGGGGDIAAIDPSILGGAGTSMGGGWMAAPGLADAGYGLPNPDDAPGWWARNIGTINKNDVTNALGSLGAANKAAQGNKAAPTAPSMPGAGQAAGLGKGGGVNLGDLVAMLARRREALLQSATGGVGAGRPQGLLGV